jgi:hypothetical protein
MHKSQLSPDPGLFAQPYSSLSAPHPLCARRLQLLSLGRLELELLPTKSSLSDSGSYLHLMCLKVQHLQSQPHVELAKDSSNRLLENSPTFVEQIAPHPWEFAAEL